MDGRSGQEELMHLQTHRHIFPFPAIPSTFSSPRRVYLDFYVSVDLGFGQVRGEMALCRVIGEIRSTISQTRCDRKERQDVRGYDAATRYIHDLLSSVFLCRVNCLIICASCMSFYSFNTDYVFLDLPGYSGLTLLLSSTSYLFGKLICLCNLS